MSRDKECFLLVSRGIVKHVELLSSPFGFRTGDRNRDMFPLRAQDFYAVKHIAEWRLALRYREVWCLFVSRYSLDAVDDISSSRGTLSSNYKYLYTYSSSQ